MDIQSKRDSGTNRPPGQKGLIMKTTPGPWKLAEINDEDGNLTHFVTSACDDSIITYALPRTYADEELMANAQLIAAAPELYEACQYLVENCENADDDGYNDSEFIEQVFIAIERAKSAIAIAKGEGR
jgi:hypothetical protein